ncbi:MULTISPECIES: HAAS signaling domain-containing protein [Streptomycetaceae]|uniref:Integral membrane protein n=1 Tax=Streptantibioticus cattleyicolor (strain ATCC 35852 / DSM 46488 / JCM 4925 / NBRC 14057 / NRRL 8057) TaxID=1003195 RepID=F8K009_STREN|nr:MULTISPECIES: hypothetical protein [Streptomycetaceae]AEW94783.1 integral membrane protein [Streptantibioticus cattleyicolor NRRL 8057 = DSM 46488]MYS59408.1 hypothetical protein [Streptomyces sp. SID5468]CCB75139.1 putative integral membrane protein [Streptantibioticus cattleyicolor NRRL 8057 = DSM 46488]
MGNDSDRLVFDYLSRVGDLAQTALPARARAELVARLRQDIERDRGAADSPSTVRRVLDRLGSPDEVVAAAAAERPRERPAPEPPPMPSVPTAPPAATKPPTPPKPPTPSTAEAAGDAWWQGPPPLDPVASGARTNEILAGWTGGLLPGIEDDDEDDGAGRTRDRPGEGVERTEEAAEAPGRARRRWWPRRAAEPSGVPAARRRGLPVGPLELLAALALVAGTVTGNWFALAIGWLLAYTTRGLTRIEAKFAALGVPGLVALGTGVWLWGRVTGRWGAPIPHGGLAPVITGDLPVVIRIAALATAAFLLWRSARSSRRAT